VTSNTKTKAQSDAFDAAVFAEQIDLLFRERFDLLANVVVASALMAFIGDRFPAWVAVSWLAAVWLVALARAAIPYRRLVAAPGTGSGRAALRVYVVAKFVTGCLWGLTGCIVLVTPDLLDHVIVLVVLAGLAVGGLVRNAAFRPAMVAFLLPAMLPGVVLLLTRPNAASVELGELAAIFVAVVAGSGLDISRTIDASLRARVYQELLVIELRASEASAAEAQQLAQVGGLEFDDSNHKIALTAEAFRIIGIDRSRFIPSLQSLLARVYPDDRAAVLERLETFLRTGETRFLEYRIVHDDGAIRFVESNGRKVEGAPGHPPRLFASIQDVTERRAAANELTYRNRLLDAVTAGTAILLRAESIEVGMPDALRVVGEGLRLDLIQVVQEVPELASTLALRAAWEAPDVSGHFDPSSFLTPPTPPAAMTAVRAELSHGKVVIGQRATGGGLLHVMLQRLGAQSILIVPIVVDEKLWGNLSANVSREARAWSMIEINTLKTFASIVGSLAFRDQQRISLETSEERVRVLMSAAQDAIVLLDGGGRIREWNRAAERILGYSAEEAVGKEFREFVPVRFAEEATRWITTFLAGREESALGEIRERPMLRKNGTEVEIEVSLTSAHFGSGWEAIAIIRDITARKESERKIAFDDMLLRTEMEASPDAILVVDGNRKIISLNQRYADLWGLPSVPLNEINDELALRVGAALVKNSRLFTDRVEFLYAHPEESGDEEIEFTDGRFIDRRTAILKSPDGAYLGRVWYFRDISERKRAEALAIQTAHFDVLTGLSNRSVFVEKLAQEIADAGRGKNAFAVLYLDLDHFKDVNDTLGHPVGDGLLRAVAGRLREHLPDGDAIARFGGDEFAVLVPEIDDPAVAGLMATNLLHALAVPFEVEGFEIRSAASIGIDVYGPESMEPEALLKHAEVALYRAKSEGRGGYRFFTEAMDLEVRTRVSLDAELHAAIDGDQLFLLYQPQVAIETGRIVGLEALVRWRHPQRGVLAPDIFIPVAESTGTIAALGRWVLFAACRQARTWLDAGIAPGRISVNVSGRQFEAPVGLEGEIAAALAESRLPPRLLEIELTETVLMGVSQEHSELLARLREAGVMLALDDFGTGYSSLGYLGRFPVDRIKIPREFVKDIATQPGEAAVARATIGLAHDFGIAVIAEGVETREQLEILKSLGCLEIQGFYFSRPLGVEDLTRVFKSGGILTPPSTSSG
jgi:diguanylate cyclase (GGDEF)-like protein/PAS domain S-box-containing protein